MNFVESIRTCFRKYFVFVGKASKSEFWYFFLFSTLGYIVIYYIALTTMSMPLLIISSIFGYGTIIPLFSVGCRRMHDIGKSGWWQIVPFYNFILFAADPVSGSTRSRTTSSIRNYNDKPKSYSAHKQRSRSGNVDLTDELEELKDLYEDGTLSEAQFKKAKNKLLK